MMTETTASKVLNHWAALLVLAASAAYGEVKVADTGYVDEKNGEITVVKRLITLDTGIKLFGFKTNGRAIGMVLPTPLNWSATELCAVKVNNESFFAYNAEDDLKPNFKEVTRFKVTAEKDGAKMEAIQEGAAAKVTLSFHARSGDDKLMMTVQVEPLQPLTSSIIVFECYPSAMEPREKLTRAFATAKRSQALQPGDPTVKVALDETEKWIFLHDQVYDLGVETTRGGKAVGGCGLLRALDKCSDAAVTLGPYHIDLAFTYGPETEQMRFTLLDFANEKSNTYGLKYMNALEAKGMDAGKH